MMPPIKLASILAMAAVMHGCASTQQSYTPPQNITPASNTVAINMPLEQAWSRAISGVAREFFSINNMDKSSGFLNINYTGAPDKYIDCGVVRVTQNDVRGTRTFEFAGQAEKAGYETFVYPSVVQVARTMALDGRVNVLFQKETDTTTRATVTSRYLVRRSMVGRELGSGRLLAQHADNIAFNSNGGAEFTGETGTGKLTCKATGALEQDILRAITP
jgi:hypothetical protein